jgi:hypothetical protein
LFPGVIKTKWSNATQDTKDKVINGLKKTIVNEGVTKEREETNDKEKGCKQNRNYDDNRNSFIFPVFFRKIIFFPSYR